MAALPGEEPLPEGYLDLYKLAVEMADRISARRGLSNSFFLTLNTAVVGVAGTQTSRWYFVVAGIALSVAWWASLLSYRNLNAAKFKVIIGMEQQLPSKIYQDEWELLASAASTPASELHASGRRLKQYRELGRVERLVPWVFVLIYVAELIRQVAS